MRVVRISPEEREGPDRFEVTAHAHSISHAAGATKGRFPDGDEFFGQETAGGSTEHSGRPVLLPDRAS